VAIAVPCHRVVPKARGTKGVPATGGTGGWRWGAARKRALLALEGAL
jgi:O6-methylguanine-DNA--protein-cysteine methyltransferase